MFKSYLDSVYSPASSLYATIVALLATPVFGFDCSEIICCSSYFDLVIQGL